MGGRGSSAGVINATGLSMGGALPNIVVSPLQATGANDEAFPVSNDATPVYRELKGGRAYFQKQTFTIDQQIAIQNYLAVSAQPGSLYSMSQNLNWNMSHGIPLTANQQYVLDELNGAMHNIGYNLKLTRYDHRDFIDRMLKAVGANKGYDKMSAAQLKAALVGVKYSENQLVSTSINDFKNAPQSSKDVFMTRACKITYLADSDVQAVMPGYVKGNDLGEMILKQSNGALNYEVVDVQFTGSKARAKSSQNYNLPQVEIIVRATKQL